MKSILVMWLKLYQLKLYQALFSSKSHCSPQRLLAFARQNFYTPHCSPQRFLAFASQWHVPQWRWWHHFEPLTEPRPDWDKGANREEEAKAGFSSEWQHRHTTALLCKVLSGCMIPLRNASSEHYFFVQFKWNWWRSACELHDVAYFLPFRFFDWPLERGSDFGYSSNEDESHMYPLLNSTQLTFLLT